MKLLPTINYCSRFLTLAVLWIILFIVTTIVVNGQEIPPRPLAVTVNLSQNLNYGLEDGIKK